MSLSATKVMRFTSAVTACGLPAQNEQTAQRPNPFTVADGKRRRQTSTKFVSGACPFCEWFDCITICQDACDAFDLD